MLPLTEIDNRRTLARRVLGRAHPAPGPRRVDPSGVGGRFRGVPLVRVDDLDADLG